MSNKVTTISATRDANAPTPGCFLVPPWCADIYNPNGEAAAAVWLLGRWAAGEDVPVNKLKSFTGWGFERAAKFIRRMWSEAGEAGAPRPDALPGEPINNGPEDALFELPGHLTHADVVQRARSWLLGRHECAVAFAEIVTYENCNPDALGFKRLGAARMWSVLVEVKISRSDFRADRKKIIHLLPDSCPGQERWYLTPPNLIRPEEVPEGWGLAEVGKRSIRIVKPAPVEEFNAARARADMGVLVAAVRRHQLGVEWLDEVGKFRPYAVTP